MKTITEALTHALVLALTAPDQVLSARATALAEDIAQSCTPKQIASAKRAAIRLVR